MKNIHYIYIALITVALMQSGCCRDKIMENPIGLVESGIPMRYAPIFPGGTTGQETKSQPVTKALINSTNDLQLACRTAEDGGEGNAIGLWADYYESVEGPVVKDVLGSNTQLIYENDGAGNRSWDYLNEEKVWYDRGHLFVRAFYPYSLRPSVVEASASALLFSIEYNAAQIQKDLMVAGNEVIIDDDVSHGGSPSIAHAISGDVVTNSTVTVHPTDNRKYGFSTAFNLGNPVPLVFHHTLAAIRVQFVCNFDHEDELLGVNFMNKAAMGGFMAQGMLVYGNEDEGYLGEAQTTLLDGRANFKWFTDQTYPENTIFFQWDIDRTKSGDNKGIPLIHRTEVDGATTTVTDIMPVAYTRTNRTIRRQSVNGLPVLPVAGAGETVVNTINEAGRKEIEVTDSNVKYAAKQDDPFYNPAHSLFNENDGYLLIIPQATSNSKMIAKFRHLGDMEWDMPAFTGTNAAGGKYVDSITPEELAAYAKSQSAPETLSEAELALLAGMEARKAQYNHFVAGHKYIITVNINHIDVNMDIESEPWHSYYAEETIQF